jgi:peptide/nickel transport system permease protein
MDTARFAMHRLVSLVVTLLISSAVIFSALYLAPGTPLSFLTRGRSMSPAEVASLRARYHLDQPLPLQYWHWLDGVIHGDFGVSIIFKRPVTSLLADRAVNTAWLVSYASVIILVFGLAIGVAAGLQAGRLDTTLMLCSTAAMAVPTFVAAVGLVAVFAVSVPWFPVFGAGSGVSGRVWHLTLPALALALSSVAYVARLSRASIRHEVESEHVQTAVSRGLRYRAVVRRHVLRNAMIPVTTVAGVTVGGLIAGAVVVETLFQLNGLGSYLVSAVEAKDFPVVQAISLIFVTAFVVINTVVDFACSMLDPRISVARRPA